MMELVGFHSQQYCMNSCCNSCTISTPPSLFRSPPFCQPFRGRASAAAQQRIEQHHVPILHIEMCKLYMSARGHRRSRVAHACTAWHMRDCRRGKNCIPTMKHQMYSPTIPALNWMDHDWFLRLANRLLFMWLLSPSI
jgi:hypothetical protein